ncbi:MAG: hypothetical protein JSS86_08515, partial [Cyanobacteria bacterium SZAS LIN-2]|nr:hypothetical protein [Cyanobacteria bacterium SZAS LIN-2]
MEKQCHQRKIRNQNGAAVILLFVIVIVAFAATLIGASEILRYCLYRQKSVAAVEGASLAVANDLSAVVVEDPNFGYIALSDYAPEGQALLAPDGEPLPVHSINTILATARLDLLIAKQLNNQEFIRLAQIDSANARLAARRLTEALKIAIAPAGNAVPQSKSAQTLLPQSFIARDRLGKKIAPRDRARQMILAYLRNCGMESKLQIESLELSLGSLQSGGGTVTPVPSPIALAEMQGRKQAGGCYLAFQNMPVGDENFVFAAVGKQSSLVPTQEFRPDDGTMPSSIVKVNVVFKIIENQKDKNGPSTFGAMKVASCSQPFSLNDKSNAGTLVVAMPDGAPQNLRSLQ